MCRLLETIKIKQGKIFNLSYHQSRFSATRQALWGLADHPSLADFICPPRPYNDQIYKCRVVYRKKIEKIEYIPYQPLKIVRLKAVYHDEINYQYKWENREALQALLQRKESCDEILIIKNNKITDTSFSNIAFYNGKKWLTPAAPLLIGTKRSQLMADGLIETADIEIKDLKLFQKAALINAMLDFEKEKILIAINNIIL